jgi:hypothetical protein
MGLCHSHAKECPDTWCCGAAAGGRPVARQRAALNPTCMHRGNMQAGGLAEP